MRRGLSSERIAQGLLKRMGFRIIESHKRIQIGEAQVAEVDMIVESPEGTLYCVEVKAGKVGVNDVRQAHGNAALLKLQPLLICKGFADRAAEVVSKELGVKVLELPEFYHILSPEELESIVREAFRSVLEEYGLLPILSSEDLSPEEVRILKAIVSTKSFEEACQILGLNEGAISDILRNLRKKGFLKSMRGYEGLRMQAKNLLAHLSLKERLDCIEERLSHIEACLEGIRQEILKSNSPKERDAYS
ncbi:MAG: restriction endonuclease [Candidatus Bathyarchaeia archaeon]